MNLLKSSFALCLSVAIAGACSAGPAPPPRIGRPKFVGRTMRFSTKATWRGSPSSSRPRTSIIRRTETSAAGT